MDNILNVLKVAGGVICGVATYMWGGLDAVLIVLIALIIIDYITGVMAALYRRELSSETGYKGIIRKVAILLIVAMAHMIGAAMGIAEIRSVVIGFYIANEGISILENVGNMGVPLPPKLMEVLAQIKGKDQGQSKEE